MVSKLSRSSLNHLEIELIDAGKKLLHLPSSSADIHNVLAQMKQSLSKVKQNPSESMHNALRPITEALIAKELVRHPEMNVNISVACCFCEILRINAPDPPYNDEHMKDFFEMVVITFEKLSHASGGCYKEMAEILKIFSSYRLAVLMMDLELDAHGVIVRLFKQFLAFADSNSSAIVLKMEEIMTIIIEESDELKHDLVGLIVAFLKYINQISSPVSWQLGEKILVNFAAQIRPPFSDIKREMSIALYDYSRLVASICKTASENDIMEDKDTTPWRCQDVEKTDSFYDPPKSVTEVKGKRKRNNSSLEKQIEIKLMDDGKKLLQCPSSSVDIHNVLTQMKQSLSKVKQNPSESINNALCPITEALIAKELVRHPDMKVNISVACCFCEILRINAPDPPYNGEQLKDIFEMVVTTFEKVSSASGGCYTEMAKVLKIFSRNRVSVLMLDLDSDAHGLIVRLFKQFLTVADSNSSATVFKMEEIMTMIIKESYELKHELVGLVVTLLQNNNRIASPVCWQLGEKVLINFGAQFNPHLPDMRRDMSIALYDYSRLAASVCNSASEKDIMQDKETTPYKTEAHKARNVKTHKINIECLETARSCQHEEKTDSFNDPPKSVTEVKGKRKRNNSILEKQLIPPHPTKVSSSEDVIVCVQGYKVKQSIAHILEAIIKKHGDIAANCIFKTPSVRSSILEVVCEVVRRIQTSNVAKKMEEIECQIADAEAANVDVTWLRAHFHKKTEVLKNSNLLLETKRNTLLVKSAARKDLKKRGGEVVAAQERVGKVEMLVNILDIVEKNLNDHILESKAKLDSWIQPSLL